MGNPRQLDLRGNDSVTTRNFIVTTPTVSTTTANQTVTTDIILGGILAQNPGTTATNLNLPTAAALYAATGEMRTGDTIRFQVVNAGTSTGVLTLVAGTGGTIPTNVLTTVGAGMTRTVQIRCTGPTTYDVY